MKIRTIVYKAVKITGRSLISFVTLWRMESPHIEYPTNIEKVIEKVRAQRANLETQIQELRLENEMATNDLEAVQ